MSWQRCRAGTAAQDQEDAMLKVGSPAPDFSVPDETGKIRTLGEFKGKTVVLWFYPRADTPG